MLITWFVALFVSAIAARFFLPNRAIFRRGQISVASGTSILAVCNLHFPATLRAIIVANQYTFQQGVELFRLYNVDTNCPDNLDELGNRNVPFVTIGNRATPIVGRVSSMIFLLSNSETIMSDTCLAVLPDTVANSFNSLLSFTLISLPGIPPGRFYFSSLYKIPLYGFPVSTLFFIKCLYIPRFSASI